MAKKKNFMINPKDFLVKPGTSISLKDFPTDVDNKGFTKETGQALLQQEIENMTVMHDKLYASSRYSILIVLQAMDAAGKDSTIRHLMSGLNPAGVEVRSFRAPSSDSLKHDYLWRHHMQLPERGTIGIFNRSHYENVLVTRVHPELILLENLPNIQSVKDINEDFWTNRYKQICRFEKNMAENGTIILKFFLHVSKKEQKKRFLERIDNPNKNWKFSIADIQERTFWKEYQKAYEDALSNTSTNEAPWYIIPADDKWYMHLIIGAILNETVERLHLSYPEASKEIKEELLKAKQKLESESESD